MPQYNKRRLHVYFCPHVAEFFGNLERIIGISAENMGISIGHWNSA